MSQENLDIQLIIFYLLLASLCLAYASWFMRNRIIKKQELMNQIFGQDLNVVIENTTNAKKLKYDFLKLLPKKYLDTIRERLSRSGQLGDISLEKNVRNKFIFGLGGLVFGAIYFLPSGGVLKALLAGIFGFFIPDILLTNTIQKRSDIIQEALPDAVEMLTMCVEAGLSFQQSLQRVSENQKNVISSEFARVMSEIQIGEPRIVALANMGDRLNHPDVTKFVTAMLQVDKLGIPISAVLGEQVTELRSRSRMRAREKAQKVPVKILGPVMVCFMPCTLIIVLGPVILSFLN